MYDLRYLALDDVDGDGSGYEASAIEIESELVHYDEDVEEDLADESVSDIELKPVSDLPPPPETVSAVLSPDAIPNADGDTAIPPRPSTKPTARAKPPTGKRVSGDASPKKATPDRTPTKESASRKGPVRKTAAKKAPAKKSASKAIAAKKRQAEKLAAKRTRGGGKTTTKKAGKKRGRSR